MSASVSLREVEIQDFKLLTLYAFYGDGSYGNQKVVQIYIRGIF